jgi:hypothetical protein
VAAAHAHAQAAEAAAAAAAAAAASGNGQLEASTDDADDNGAPPQGMTFVGLAPKLLPSPLLPPPQPRSHAD